MAESEIKLIRKSDFLVDLVVVGAFFLVFMFKVLPSHVPSNDPAMINLWSGITAACISGVFWLALWMLRVVARYQKELRLRK